MGGGGPLGSGSFRAEKRPHGALAPNNDPQFLEHLDGLMNRQNNMEAQLIQMQTQLQSTNDILEQQAAARNSRGGWIGGGVGGGQSPHFAPC